MESKSRPRTMQGRPGARSSRGPGGRPDRKFYPRRRVCRFCVDSTVKMDYKKPEILRTYLTEKGKIIPRRISGNCAKHQREIAREIKRARNIALLPFAVLEG
ncbi:MAG TPA: 30S ribosomal protein S18 [Syntrophales bacterium]|nr:30S ribosomal protein S18 [Syntrophales bacterium]